jgi:hypothetical protein
METMSIERTAFLPWVPVLVPILALWAAPAPAQDRQPTEDERAAIGEVLRAQGYTAWKEIELDDGRWEIDDAVLADGTRHDLTLNPDTLAIIETRED